MVCVCISKISISLYVISLISSARLWLLLNKDESKNPQNLIHILFMFAI